MKAVIVLALLSLAVPASAKPDIAGRDPGVLQEIDFAPAPGAQLPLDAAFKDESGQPVKLGDYFGERPVVLAPVYYECPMLCTLTLNGLLRASRAIRQTAGKEFEIVAFSIDPAETPDLAAAKDETYRKGYNRRGPDGWHFLTGSEESIRAVSQALNFRYVYDPKSDQYAHASGLVVATPDGRIARTLYGPEFAPRDLKLAVIESSEGRIGSVTEKVLLYCYAFDGANGRYSMRIMRVVQLAGATTAVVLFTSVGIAFRRERKSGKNTPRSGDPS